MLLLPLESHSHVKVNDQSKKSVSTSKYIFACGKEPTAEFPFWGCDKNKTDCRQILEDG